jgi:transketolase
MRNNFIDTVVECAKADSRIWLLCGDLGYSVLERFSSVFPERFINVGVAEQNMASMAAGLAMTGRIVITYSIGNFGTLRCYEQIRNDVCYHDANVKIIAIGGGLVYGGHGYTHHAVEDIAAMRALPNMTVLAPADPVEAKLATLWMLSHPHPCYLRLEKAGEAVLHPSTPAFEPGRMISLNQGKDIQIITTGSMLAVAVDVAKQLVAKGISAGVTSSPFIKPFDTNYVQQQGEKMKWIATLEEHSPYGGLGDCAAVALATMGGARAQLITFNVPEGVLKGVSGDHSQLRARAGISADAIVAGILKRLS